MNLFTAEINGWQSWGNIFQSIPAFEPIIKSIFDQEKLPITTIEHVTPGTNAVFKVGKLIVKIFAPQESGINSTTDFETETFALERAMQLGISVPTLRASGTIEDKYPFSYIVMEYVDGSEFNQRNKNLSPEEKVLVGQRLRTMTDTLNTPCQPFNDIDVIFDPNRQQRWEPYPERFRKERLDYLRSHDFGKQVFVHGDLNGDNILIDDNLDLHIIDFADAVLAPTTYEQSLIVLELFRFDPFYLEGYFGGEDPENIIDLCFNGILIHDFGGDIIKQFIASPKELASLEYLKALIRKKLNKSSC